MKEAKIIAHGFMEFATGDQLAVLSCTILAIGIKCANNKKKRISYRLHIFNG
jgi:hypothetical protein